MCHNVGAVPIFSGTYFYGIMPCGTNKHFWMNFLSLLVVVSWKGALVMRCVALPEIFGESFIEETFWNWGDSGKKRHNKS